MPSMNVDIDIDDFTVRYCKKHDIIGQHWTRPAGESDRVYRYRMDSRAVECKDDSIEIKDIVEVFNMILDRLNNRHSV